MKRTVLIVLMLCPAWSYAAARPLTVRVSPLRALAPADVLVTVILERHDDNRQLEIVIESSAYFQASTIDLDGARASGARDVRFRQLPPGNYEVRVGVMDAGGRERALARRYLSVS